MYPQTIGKMSRTRIYAIVTQSSLGKKQKRENERKLKRFFLNIFFTIQILIADIAYKYLY